MSLLINISICLFLTVPPVAPFIIINTRVSTSWTSLTTHNQQTLTAFITHYPCIICTRLLLAAGIKKIYYINDYKNDSLVPTYTVNIQTPNDPSIPTKTAVYHELSHVLWDSFMGGSFAILEKWAKETTLNLFHRKQIIPSFLSL